MPPTPSQDGSHPAPAPTVHSASTLHSGPGHGPGEPHPHHPVHSNAPPEPPVEFLEPDTGRRKAYYCMTAFMVVFFGVLLWWTQLRQPPEEAAAVAHGRITVETDPAGLAYELWRTGAAPERLAQGTAPGMVENLAGGDFRVVAHRPGWPDKDLRVHLKAGQHVTALLRFPSGVVRVESDPPGASVRQGEERLGETPLELPTVPPGQIRYEVELADHYPATVEGWVDAGRELVCRAVLRPKPVLAEGRPWTVPDLELAMVWVPPGRFFMGSAPGEPRRDRDEEPRTEVRLTRGFWIGQYEVTQGEFQAVLGRNPAQYRYLGPRAPVESVTWAEAMAFAQALNDREAAAGRLPEGYRYQLPTEAQWEYACRAGQPPESSPDLDRVAWYEPNSAKVPHLVGLKEPNPWGLYDTLGNVAEWCRDWAGTYPGTATDNLAGPVDSATRATRGGGWNDPASTCRAAERFPEDPTARLPLLGFRLVLAP